MSRLRIDTDIVASVVASVRACNSRIRDDFEGIRNAVTELNSNWNSPASANMLKKMQNLDFYYKDTRYNEMDNFTSFLNNQVKEGYEETENANTSLADMFK